VGAPALDRGTVRDGRRLDWWAWREYARSIRILVCEEPIPPDVLGCVLRPTVAVVTSWLPLESRSLVAWHEIGHMLLHPECGDRWRELTNGAAMHGRLERQPWRFALGFPHWDEDALAAALDQLVALGGRLPFALSAELDRMRGAR